MKISTKGRYAVQLMLDLAVYNTGSPVSIRDIARREDISEKYLEQIIAVLNKAGYVKSVRGPQGGYLLTRNPQEYTVGMILRALEGDLSPVSCITDGGCSCDRSDECVTIKVWQKINDAVNQVVDNITLVDMLEWREEKADNYVI